jgi:hypothetical protein
VPVLLSASLLVCDAITLTIRLPNPIGHRPLILFLLLSNYCRIEDEVEEKGLDEKMSSTSWDEELCTSNSVYRKTLGIVQTEFFIRKRRNIYKVSAVRERETSQRPAPAAANRHEGRN